MDTLNNDKEHLQERRKLTLTDIHKLTELCLSKYHFLCENNLRLFQNSGPIGLALMVVLSECYLQKIEFKAVTEALNYKIAPKTFRRFVDDSHACFQNRSHANKFLQILNKQDPAIKYTAEFEDHKHSLNVLDINITNNTTKRKCEFKVHRKDAITNIHIKPNSCIDLSITKSVFKGFLHRAHTICSEKFIMEEIQFLLNIFVENGHNGTFLEASVKDYNTKNNNHNHNDTNRKKIPWIPNMGPKIMKEFKKVNKDITATSGKDLQSILCQNKLKLLPNSHPGVYQLDCSFNGIYIGESKKKILTRCTEHQSDSIKGNWESSGTTEHTKECYGQFNGIHPRTIAIMSNTYKKKVREALEINRLKTLNGTDKTFKVLNRDNGDYEQLETTLPENRKPLNCNFDVRFYVSLKTAFSKSGRNITTC